MESRYLVVCGGGNQARQPNFPLFILCLLWLILSVG